MLGHAESVGQFHPLHSIDIHGKIPLVHFTRTHPEHECIEASDHEALNMVRITQTQSLTQRIPQTDHLRLSSPVK